MRRWLISITLTSLLLCRPELLLAQDQAEVHNGNERIYSIVKGAGEVPLLVVETGNRSNPTIVFLHGMSQSHLAWEAQFDSELADHFHLVAFDLRGHGGSGKPWQEADYSGSQVWADDVDAVIKAFDLEDVTIAAWSFGGYVAMAYLRTYGSDNVKAINLVGSLAGLTEGIDNSQEISEEMARGAKNRASLNLRKNIQGHKAMPDLLFARPIPNRDRKWSFYSSLMFPSYVLRSLSNLPLKNEDMIDLINVPVLVTVGSEDVGVSETDAAVLAEKLPNASLSTYKGVGHSPMLEEAGRYNLELEILANGSSIVNSQED